MLLICWSFNQMFFDFPFFDLYTQPYNNGILSTMDHPFPPPAVVVYAMVISLQKEAIQILPYTLFGSFPTVWYMSYFILSLFKTFMLWIVIWIKKV